MDPTREGISPHTASDMVSVFMKSDIMSRTHSMLMFNA